MKTSVDLMDDIKLKQDEAAELRTKLEKSLTISDLWPGCFDKGGVKVRGRSTIHEPHFGVIIVTRGDGEKKEFPALSVPFRLWPESMQENYNALPGHVRKKYDKRIIG